eukprot:contig_7063_g1635
MHGITAERVMAMLTLWCQRRKAVLVLDAWENVSHHHIVKLMAIIGDKAVFLDSMYCGDECQDAEGQAQLLQEKLVNYGGLTNFNAVGSDNAAACLEMRRRVTANNPGLVSLNDQAHVAKLLLGDLCKISWLKNVVQTDVTVSAYVRNHQGLLAAYSLEKVASNKGLSSESAGATQTAVAYVTPGATRFLCTRDLVLACVRNRPAQRSLLERNNGTELPRLVKARDQAARESQAAFLRIAESATDARDWAALCQLLDPL